MKTSPYPERDGPCRPVRKQIILDPKTAAEQLPRYFRALDFFSGEAHQQFLRHMASLNTAVARTGLAQTEYLVWTVMGEQAGPFSHVYGSLWPDRATYDAVQEHEAVQAVVKRFEE